MFLYLCGMLFGRTPYYFNCRAAAVIQRPVQFRGDGTMFYLPFFILGAYAFKYVWQGYFSASLAAGSLGSLLLFIAYMLNQKLLAHSSYMFELEVVIKT